MDMFSCAYHAGCIVPLFFLCMPAGYIETFPDNRMVTTGLDITHLQESCMHVTNIHLIHPYITYNVYVYTFPAKYNIKRTSKTNNTNIIYA